MEGVPTNLDTDKLKQDLLAIEGVNTVSDLHVWSTGSKAVILTAHVGANIINEKDYAEKLKSIQAITSKTYGISHITIQLVPMSAISDLKDICQHCS